MFAGCYGDGIRHHFVLTNSTVRKSRQRKPGKLKATKRSKSVDGMSKRKTIFERTYNKPDGSPVKITNGQWWLLRSKHGREKLFKSPDLLWEAACEYFESVISSPLKEQQAFAYQGDVYKDTVEKMRPFTMIGLTLYIGCSSSYLRAFKSTINAKDESKRTDEDEKFLTVISNIEDVVYNQKFEGAAAGFLNANIISRDLGLAEKTEHSIEDNRKAVAEMFPKKKSTK